MSPVKPKAVIIVYLLLSGISLLNAQFYFGRNKIQFEQFDWQILSTEHFNIYYYQEEEELAQAAATFIEEAFVDLEIKFNHTLNKVIPLVIYSSHIHFQQTNILQAPIPEGIGGFFEFIKGRVVIPYNGNMGAFKHVIRHELVHVFMHSKINTGVTNSGLWDSPRAPLWFSEGLAEWWSRGWDSQAEMVIRDALLYDNLIPLQNAGGFIVYKEGQAFFRYYEKNYGAERIRRLMEEFWLYPTFEEAINAISGKDYKDIMTDWELSLKQEAAAALKTERVPTTGVDQLTERGINVSPAVYRDNSGKQHLLYLSNQEGYTNIYSHELESNKKILLVKGERTAGFESLHILQSGISVNGEGLLAFVTKNGEQDEIKLIDVATRQLTGSYSHPKLISIRSPRWSFDNRQIVFSGQDFSGRSDLYMWEVSKDYSIRLTNDLYSDQDPCFSPDGKQIVFSSDRGQSEPNSGLDLVLLDLTTRGLQLLTNDRYSNTKPYWNPRKPEQLLYISDRSGTPNLWMIKLPGMTNSNTITLKNRQASFLHTGVLEVIPVSGDSVLINTFQDYSFQLHLVKPEANDSSAYTIMEIRPPATPWSITSAIDSNRIKDKSPYRLKYSLDFAQTAVAYDPIYGFLGGAQLSVSDLLGNRYYHFLIANTAQTTSEFLDRFNVAVTMVNLSRRANFAVGVFHFANEYYDPYQAFYFERTVGIRAGLSYPFDVFRRFEFSMSLWNSSKDRYFEKVENSLLLSNYISLVHDNSLWTPIGPIDGWRARVTIGPTFNFIKAKLHNYTGLADFRYYYHPVRYLTFAHRSMLWFNDGTDIRRFYIGGSWGIRGYEFNEIYGRKLIMLNHEIRFPFANSLALNFRSTSVGLAPIHGAVFVDAGNAWDHEFPGWIGSFGVGLRGTLFGVLVLRYDVGRRTDFHSISDRWFWQFFFGWDY